ncbi:MAG: NnrU family protein [Devosia sp.]|nr:NnrU family protein [Devosia sp.]
MWVLILGLVVFFVVHSVRMVAGGFREAQLASAPGIWKGLYSLVSLAGFALIIWGWILFRPDAPEIFEPPAWGRHAASLLVLVAFILLAAANMPAGYIKKWVRHPMLVGVMLWALGHLLANGDLASLLLFGSFLVYSAVNRVAVIPRGDPAPSVLRPRSDLVAVLAGAVLYALFAFWLHGVLFGTAPFG